MLLRHRYERGTKYRVEHVCSSICPLVYLQNYPSNLRHIYSVPFRGWRHVCTYSWWPGIGDSRRRILNVTQQEQHRFNTAAYSQTDPPRVAPNRGRSLISVVVFQWSSVSVLLWLHTVLENWLFVVVRMSNAGGMYCVYFTSTFLASDVKIYF